jgi:hypothetical protein
MTITPATTEEIPMSPLTDQKLEGITPAERLAAAAPDPICGDPNDGDWCELEPGHAGNHRADTAEWPPVSA